MVLLLELFQQVTLVRCVDLIDTTREMAIAAEKNPEQIAYLTVYDQ